MEWTTVERAINTEIDASEVCIQDCLQNTQAKLRTMHNDWWTALERTQCYADTGDMRAFNEALKAVYGPSQSDPSPSTLFGRK